MDSVAVRSAQEREDLFRDASGGAEGMKKGSETPEHALILSDDGPSCPLVPTSYGSWLAVRGSLVSAKFEATARGD